MHHNGARRHELLRRCRSEAGHELQAQRLGQARGFKNPSKVSLNDHIGRAETEKVTRQSDG